MNLNILLIEYTIKKGIFIIDDSEILELSNKEWNSSFPNIIPKIISIPKINELYSINIENNLDLLAKKLGIYDAIWKPNEIGIKKSKELIGILKEARKKLYDNPSYFKKVYDKDKWFYYDIFLSFITEYCKACIRYPNSIIVIGG